MKNATKLIHIDGSPDKSTGSVVVPLHISTIFAMETPSSNDGFQYGRAGNPTRLLLEKTLADLEGAKQAAVFSSGSAALTTIFSTLKSGDQILCHHEIYEGTTRILEKVFKNFGVTIHRIDMNKTEVIEKMINKKTKMIIFETPTNPSLELLDIQKICSIAKQHKIISVVDNTLASPIIQQPIKLGATIVIESMTKFINGHSDVLGGLIATNDEKIFNKIRFLQITLGATLSPQDAHIILRSLKTLHIRVKEQQRVTRVVLTFLKNSESIEKIYFPNNEISNVINKRQMKGNGSIISFSLAKRSNPDMFIKNLKLIIIGHSFGGVESVIQQPFRMMDHDKKSTITKNFFRLSIGLENPDDLVSDLKQALDQSL